MRKERNARKRDLKLFLGYILTSCWLNKHTAIFQLTQKFYDQEMSEEKMSVRKPDYENLCLIRAALKNNAASVVLFAK